MVALKEILEYCCHSHTACVLTKDRPLFLRLSLPCVWWIMFGTFWPLKKDKIESWIILILVTTVSHGHDTAVMIPQSWYRSVDLLHCGSCVVPVSQVSCCLLDLCGMHICTCVRVHCTCLCPWVQVVLLISLECAIFSHKDGSCQYPSLTMHSL